MSADGMIVPMDLPIAAQPVQVNQWLVGSKQAIDFGGVIHVSPAMFELLRHAEGDELERLLQAIPVVTIPVPTSLPHGFPS
jgi:hypothetical protein